MSKNLMIIIGNLGKDPEVRSFGDNKEVVTFSVACTEKYKDKQSGEYKEVTDWINCKSFTSTNFIKSYIQKGSQVYLEGKFKTDSWVDNNGIKKYSSYCLVNNIQLLGKSDSANNAPTQHSVDKGNAYQPQTQGVNPSLEDELNDDFDSVPF